MGKAYLDSNDQVLEVAPVVDGSRQLLSSEWGRYRELLSPERGVVQGAPVSREGGGAGSSCLPRGGVQGARVS